MTRLQMAKTSFTSGEIDPGMYGRPDLNAFQEGAAKLRNVLVLPTGGVTRRPGTRFIASLPGTERLIALDSREGQYLLAMGESQVSLRDTTGGTLMTAPSLWTSSQLWQITWTYLDDGLMICHPDVPPQLVKKGPSGNWTMAEWQFDMVDGANGSYSAQPYSKLAGEQTALQATNLNLANPNEDDPIPAGADVRLMASEPLFTSDHFGTVFRLKGREVRIQTVVSSTEARAITLQELVDGKATAFFDEQAFSDARGWPAAATRHQDRLVIGGSGGAPDLVWCSKTGRYFNFDLATGLDDEAVSFRIGDGRLHRIRHFVSGRSLQILTSLGEWIVPNAPLTPSNIQLEAQTNAGSPLDRQIRPLVVDGATLFTGASKRDVREFVFTDIEQAFQAPDIALLSRHLIAEPRDMAFASDLRVAAMVLASGDVATAAIDRNANVIAWSLQSFAGPVKSVASIAGELFLLIERANVVHLEKLDSQNRLDAAVNARSETPANLWNGFDHLIGQTIQIVADGASLGEFLIASGTLDIGQNASHVIGGLPFEHEIEPLPVTSAGRSSPIDTLYRPIRSAFRVQNCGSLRVQTEQGERTLIDPASANEPVSGDFSLRDFGWRRGQGRWPWKIVMADPQPFTLLSATTELKVNH